MLGSCKAQMGGLLWGQETCWREPIRKGFRICWKDFRIRSLLERYVTWRTSKAPYGWNETRYGCLLGLPFPVFLLKKIRICKRHKHTRYTRENSWRLFCWMEDWNLRTMWRSEPLSRLLWPEGISYSATPPKAQMPVPCASAWLKQLNATGLIHLDTFCSFCRSFPNSETNQLVSNSCRYCLGLRRSLNIAICLDFLSISVSRCSYFLPSRGIIDRLR